MVTTPLGKLLIEFIEAEIARTGESPRLTDIAKALNCSPQDICVLRYSELKSVKGIDFCRQHLGRLEKAGEFPLRMKISKGRVGWIEAEIDCWLQSKADARSWVAPEKD